LAKDKLIQLHSVMRHM